MNPSFRLFLDYLLEWKKTLKAGRKQSLKAGLKRSLTARLKRLDKNANSRDRSSDADSWKRENPNPAMVEVQKEGEYWEFV
jgi:hypothetical protein